MTVPMVMVCMGADCLEIRGSAAAVGGLAADGLTLNGGVVDVKAICQGAFDTVKDAAALGQEHLVDSDVAGERVRVGAQAPDMKIVHVEHTRDGLHGEPHLGEIDGMGGAFEKDIEGLANDSHRAPKNHSSYED